jgi:hypothetical protein
MPLVSTSNFWILVVGVLLVAVNVLASSRLAPLIASFFKRLAHRSR